MAKIRIITYINHESGFKYHHDQYAYFCKGCGYEHVFGLKSEGGHHDFNMDLDKPTVSPSLLQNFDPKNICHSFMKDGFIQYLGDCHHDLKNQTIELPEIEN